MFNFRTNRIVRKAAMGLLFTPFFVTSTTTYANDANFTAPEQCAYGRYQTDLSLGDLEGALQAGLDVYQNGGAANQANMWFQVAKLVYNVFESYDYLRVEIPKHVIQGESFRAKGNLFDKYAYVRFHNSELGYVGKDKSNLDANSYLNMKFPKTHGVGLVWITRGDNTQCSMEMVYVQKKPKINTATVRTGYNRVDVDVSYFIDKFSKAAVNTNGKTKITVRTRNDVFGHIETKSFYIDDSVTRKQVTMYPKSGGPHDVWVTVSDGNYSVQKALGQHFIPGDLQKPCPTCNAL